MTIPNKRFTDGLHYYQRHALWAFHNKKARFFMFEWARRHRKTTFAINHVIAECCRYPKSKYAYVAPTQVWARNVIWDDPTMLNDALPDKAEMGWVKNESKMIIVFENGSILKIGGSDKPDTFRGIDVTGVIFDEWALCKEELWTEAFRPIIAGPIPPHLADTGAFRWAMFLYTPKGINHATMMFDNACMVGLGGEVPEDGPAEMTRKGWYASRIDAEVAGIMSDYELSEAKKDMPQVLYDQELRCKRASDEERTLITSAMLNDLNGIDWEAMRDFVPETRKIVSIDPAFLGDICSIRGMINTRTEYLEHTHPTKTEQIVAEAKVMAAKLKTKNFIVDIIGVGKGVGDMLAADEAKYNVQFFNSSEVPIYEPDLCANQRAAAYMYASNVVRKCRCEAITEKELLRQLPVASRYTSTGRGKVILIPKKEIKKELKCSPDDADSWVMGIYGLQFVQPEEKAFKPEGKYRDKVDRSVANNPMTF